MSRWGPVTAAAMVALFAVGCARETPTSPAAPAAPRATCLGSGDETAINAALSGPAGTVVLCQGAVFDLRAPVVFQRDGQQLYTEGLPTGVTRATLRVASPTLAVAVTVAGRSGIRLSHIIVDGNRPALGRIAGGSALIEAGGDASGQLIEHVLAFEPRGWTCLHAWEGAARSCRGMTIANNELGPAGQADGAWADGLSFACPNSLVHHNTVTDATDGGIVVFGAPGSVVAGNTVRAVTRPLLGGITMVDYGPFNGDFGGTVVDANIIEGAGRQIRIGLAMGTHTWTCLPDATRLSGAIVSHNTLLGDMGYGYAVDGVNNWVVMDNVDRARHSGAPTRSCAGRLPATPGPFQLMREHSSGTFQPEFVDATLDSALFAFGDPAPQPLGRPW